MDGNTVNSKLVINTLQLRGFNSDFLRDFFFIFAVGDQYVKSQNITPTHSATATVEWANQLVIEIRGGSDLSIEVHNNETLKKQIAANRRYSVPVKNANSSTPVSSSPANHISFALATESISLDILQSSEPFDIWFSFKPTGSSSILGELHVQLEQSVVTPQTARRASLAPKLNEVKQISVSSYGSYGSEDPEEDEAVAQDTPSQTGVALSQAQSNSVAALNQERIDALDKKGLAQRSQSTRDMSTNNSPFGMKRPEFQTPSPLGRNRSKDDEDNNNNKDTYKELMKDLFSGTESKQERAVIHLENILRNEMVESICWLPTSQRIIQGSINKIIRLTIFSILNEVILLRIVWCICKIASEDDTVELFCSCGGLMPLIKFINSNNDAIKEQIIWYIMKLLTLDETKSREITSHGAIGPLINLMVTSNSTQILQNTLKILINVCMDAESAEIIINLPNGIAITKLLELVNMNAGETSSDQPNHPNKVEEIQYLALWALTNLSAIEDGQKAIVEADGLQPLVNLLQTPKTDHQIRMIQKGICAIANLAYCESNRLLMLETRLILPLVNCLTPAFNNPNLHVVQAEAARALAALAVSPVLRTAIADTKAVFRLNALVNSSENILVKQQSLWALAVLAADEQHREEMIAFNILKPLGVSLLEKALHEPASLCIAKLAQHEEIVNRVWSDNAGVIDCLIQVLLSEDKGAVSAAAKALNILGSRDQHKNIILSKIQQGKQVKEAKKDVNANPGNPVLVH